MPKVRELKPEPVVAPVDDEFSHWESGKYECKCPGCGGKSYPARIFGPWAVYKHYNDANGWELVHVKTNLAALSMVPESEAMRAGDWLFRKFPLVFRLVDYKEMRAKLEAIKPNAIQCLQAWRVECEKAKKFIVPVSLA